MGFWFEVFCGHWSLRECMKIILTIGGLLFFTVVLATLFFVVDYMFSFETFQRFIS